MSTCKVRREGDEWVCHAHGTRWAVGEVEGCPRARFVFATGAETEGHRFVAVGRFGHAEAMRQIREKLKP